MRKATWRMLFFGLLLNQTLRGERHWSYVGLMSRCRYSVDVFRLAGWRALGGQRVPPYSLLWTKATAFVST
ncbi:hypothetical protein BKA81DRAFT_359551 [Phyllosticta paracitricarpa]